MNALKILLLLLIILILLTIVVRAGVDAYRYISEKRKRTKVSGKITFRPLETYEQLERQISNRNVESKRMLLWFDPSKGWYELFSSGGEHIAENISVNIEDSMEGKTKATIISYVDIVNYKPKKK